MVVVIGKLSHCGVYGKVFTGKDWMVSKLHLLSFCFDGTHVAVGPSVYPQSILPGWCPSSAAWTADAPAVRCGMVERALQGSGLDSSFCPGGHQLCVSPYFATQDAETTRCVFCSSQARPSWHVGYQLADSNNNKELECCRRIKRSFSNKCNYTNMLEPCVLFNSCPRREAFLRALLLSE